MVALPSLSSVGYKSRNRTPYQNKMSATNNVQRFKRKVNGYQKPIQGIKRSKQEKGINELQNQQYGVKRNSTPFVFTSNVNPSSFDHLTFPIQQRNEFHSMVNQNDSNSNTMDSTSSYYTPKYGTQDNMPQPRRNKIPNQNKYRTSATDPSSKQSYFDTFIQGQLGLNEVRSNLVTTSSKYTQKKHIDIPHTTPQGLQLTEGTNKLLLSLDRDLINLVASGTGSIPPPELSDKTSLKIRRLNVIDALYNKEDKKCPNCGLRFTKEDKASFDDHLDEHFRQNVELNRTRRGELCNRRKWYPNFARIKSSETKVNEDYKTKQPEQKIPMIPIDEIIIGLNEDILRCSLCCEDFEQVFIDDQNLRYKTNPIYGELKEGWYLKNAIWSSSEVIHPTCSNDNNLEK